MSIFNQVIAGLTGERSLRQTRDRSISAAQKAFDPTVFDPQLDVARQQATQGIDEDVYRRNVLNQLFRPVDASVYGGNQAAAIAGTASVDASRAQAMGQFEGGLAMQDIAARQAGAERLGQLQSQQLQTQAQRDAYTDVIRSEYAAEVDSRRQLLGASVAKFGIEAMGGAGAIGGAIGGGLSALKDKAEVGIAGLRGMFNVIPTEVPVAQLDPNRFPQMQPSGGKVAETWGIPWTELERTARTFDSKNPVPGAPMPFSIEDVDDFPRWTPPATVPRRQVATQQPSSEYTERIRTQTKPPREIGPWPKELFERFPRAMTVGIFEELFRPNRVVEITVDTYLNNPGLEERTLQFIKNDPVGYGRKLSPEVRAWFEQRHPGIFNPPRR